MRARVSATVPTLDRRSFLANACALTAGEKRTGEPVPGIPDDRYGSLLTVRERLSSANSRDQSHVFAPACGRSHNALTADRFHTRSCGQAKRRGQSRGEPPRKARSYNRGGMVAPIHPRLW
jgi:hypothetical protein